MIFLYIISGIVAYILMGAAYQGYTEGVNKSCDYDHWLKDVHETGLPFFFWPLFLMSFPFRYAYGLFTKIGDKQIKNAKARQDNLVKLRKELSEAEQEVERSLLRKDETIFEVDSLKRVE